jgi:hypothetical protein
MYTEQAMPEALLVQRCHGQVCRGTVAANLKLKVSLLFCFLRFSLKITTTYACLSVVAVVLSESQFQQSEIVASAKDQNGENVFI